MIFRVEKDMGKLLLGVKFYIGEGDIIMNREIVYFVVNNF